MIVVDTNVISELMRPQPDSRVAAWTRLQPRGGLYATTVSEGELRYGIAILPTGKRRNELAAMADEFFSAAFMGRILTFDRAAAVEFAEIGARRREAGNPITPLDCQIAAIARSNGATIATRNTADFRDCGVRIINPWDAA